MSTGRRIFERSALGIVGVVLLWQAVLGAALWVRTAETDLKTEGMFDSEGRRLERAFGEHWETYRVLAGRVPEDGIIICNLALRPEPLDSTVQEMRLLHFLRHSLHPRVVREMDIDAPEVRAMFEGTTKVFVCDFAPDSGPPLTAPLVSVERTDRFELWTVGRD